MRRVQVRSCDGHPRAAPAGAASADRQSDAAGLLLSGSDDRLFRPKIASQN
jgi:hypothetical protein